MPGRTKPLRLLVAAALALVAAAGAAGFTFLLNNNTGLPIKWPAGAVPLRIMLGSARVLQDGSTFNSTAEAAALDWNTRLGSVRFEVSFPAASGGGNGDRRNDVFFSTTVYGSAFDSNTIAVTTTFRDGNERTEADVIFNSARSWDSYRGPSQSSGGTSILDLRRVALHEFGHALGLGHPDEDAQSVVAVMNSRVSSVDSLQLDDISGGQSLYGPPGVPPNDRFADAIPIALSSDNTAVVNGHNTNATKESGEPAHAGDAGGSSVWWRWVAPSSGRVNLNTRGSYYDTTLGVYTGTSVGALTQVASNDDINPGIVQASTVDFDVTRDTVYRIAVDGWERDTGGITMTLTFNQAVGTAPAITTHPAGFAVAANGSAVLSVAATGTEPLSFQWFLNNNAIAGATGTSFSIINAQSSSAGNYHVTVSNAFGSVTSNTAVVTVTSATPPPPSGGGGGGGGGGAPSGLFLAALATLIAVRLAAGRRAD